MRILLANANTTEAITELCAAAARGTASPGTVIVPATPRFGPAVISTRAENAIASHAVLDLLAGYATGEDRVDAVLLAVTQDRRIIAARDSGPFGIEAALGRWRDSVVAAGACEIHVHLLAEDGMSRRSALLDLMPQTGGRSED